MTFPAVITIQGRVYQPAPTTSYLYDGWRLKYPDEGGNWNPNGMPAVSPSANAQPIEFTAELQRLSWDLMYYINKTMDTRQWRVVYEYDTAFTNQNGFDEPGDQRADWINMLNTDLENPKLMKAIICAGNFFKGVIEKNAITGKDELVMYPGVHGIDTTTNLPSISSIIAKRWYFYATNWHKDTPQGDKGSPFAQGNGGHVAIPYCLNNRTAYPLEWFQRWQSNELPDAYKVYIQG